jgi:hypothetical protein
MKQSGLNFNAKKYFMLSQFGAARQRHGHA